MNFYAIVIIIAILGLVGILATMGYLANKTIPTGSFPTNKQPCPDFWTYNPDDKSCTMGETNRLNNDIGTNTPTDAIIQQGVDDSNATEGITPYPDTTIDFSKSSWDAQYANYTPECRLNQWSADNKIMWDGVSNLNTCVPK